MSQSKLVYLHPSSDDFFIPLGIYDPQHSLLVRQERPLRGVILASEQNTLVPSAEGFF